VTTILDVADVQRALDALIAGDLDAAAALFTTDVVFTGIGGCLGEQTVGLPDLLARFAEMARLSQGTFGTEVEAVYSSSTHIVAIVRHWAMLAGVEARASQALLLSIAVRRAHAVEVLGASGPTSGLWD
jgi:hypothetical protein